MQCIDQGLADWSSPCILNVAGVAEAMKAQHLMAVVDAFISEFEKSGKRANKGRAESACPSSDASTQEIGDRNSMESFSDPASRNS